MKKDKKEIVIALLALLIAVGIIAIMLKFSIPHRAIRKVKSYLNDNVIVYEESVDIDTVDKPFTIVYISDNHVTAFDDRDEEIREKAETRYLDFMVDSKDSEENFQITMKYIRDMKPDLVIIGGDLIDSATYKSIESVENELNKLKCPYIFITGNHDFEYGTEYFSEKAYSEYLPRIENITDINKGYQLKEFDDFVVLGADDVNNQLSSDISEGINEAEKTGKPVIVVTHVPFVPFENPEELIQKSNEVWGGMDSGDSRTLMGYGGIRPNGDTQEMMKFIAREDSPVKLVVSGHVHFYHKDRICNDIYQVISGPGYKREILKITLE